MELKHLEVKLSRATSMPILPTMITQVMMLADNPNAGTRDFEKVISRDSVMTAKILRMANSAYYGGDGNITGLQFALAKLGCNVVRSICVSVAMQSSLNSKSFGKTLNITQLWQHSLAVACAAKVLATLKRDPHAEEAFISGLMHDLGKVALAMFLPEETNKVYATMQMKKISQYEAEQECISITHQQIGFAVAGHWSIPQMYHSAIKNHHTPFAESIELDPLTAYVHVGNAIAHQAGLGVTPFDGNYEPDPLVLEFLGIDKEQLAPLQLAVATSVSRLSSQMGLAA